MIRFILAARKKPEDTQERYFYEWSMIHVALMLTTPSVMDTFRRYVQNYEVSGVPDDLLILPRSAMAWDNMADHLLDPTPENLDRILKSDPYVRRMQPHRFGDKAFKIEFTDDHVTWERDDFVRGGLKLVHFVRAGAGVDQAAFEAAWRGAHADVLRDALGGGLRRIVQSGRREVTGVSFEGSLFAMGNVGEYAGVEEIWLDSVDDLRALGAGRERIRESMAGFADVAGSFSMVCAERLIYDYATAATPSPVAAVLQPGTLEAAVDAQGYGPFNVVPGL